MLSSDELLEFKIDSIVNRHIKPTDPGIAVLVHKEGETSFRRGYGMADLERKVPFKPNTMGYIGSVAKQFTAMAVMICAERGLLKVNDPLLHYFPEFPDLWNEVTIHHLLTHQSGIPDYSNDLGYYFNGIKNQDAITYVIENNTMNFLPGEKFKYSNTGYILLAELVERTAKTPFTEFCQHEIFDPLGMHNSLFLEESQADIPGRAIGYTKQGKLNDYFLRTEGDGGMISTVDDLLIWNESLYTEKLVKTETITTIFGKHTEIGEGAFYGYGWVIGNVRGLDNPTHSGGSAGTSAYISRIAEQDFFLAMIANGSGPELKVNIIRAVLLHYFPE